MVEGEKYSEEKERGGVKEFGNKCSMKDIF
jgi:hypothetical protein